MTSTPDQIIEKLNGIRPRLSLKDDIHAKKEALELSKQLAASLEEPENAAVNLCFAVLHSTQIHALTHRLIDINSHSLP